MKKLIILAFLISMSIFANPTISISKVMIGNTEVEDINFDFKENFFNIEDLETKTKEISITFVIDADTDTTSEPVTGITIKNGEEKIIENTTMGTGELKTISFTIGDIYKEMPQVKDDGSFSPKLVVLPENLGGFKNLTFHYDNKAPETPSSSDITTEAGDQHVNLTWKKVDDIDNYIVYYRKVDTETVKSKTTFTNSIDITKLDNNSEYEFKIKSVDKAGNESEDGDFDTQATPSPTTDFWESYRENGGEETGGCNYSSQNSSYFFIIFMIFLFIIRKSILRGNNNE